MHNPVLSITPSVPIRYLSSLFKVGVKSDQPYPEKRTVLLSNYMAFILCGVDIALMVMIPENHNLSAFYETLIGVIVFSVPFFLNQFGYYTLNRLYLSWVPTLLITWFMIYTMRMAEQLSVTSYDGLRFYLLGFGILPYLLFGKNSPIKLFLAALPSVIIIIFCDAILNLAGVGYNDVGVYDPGYGFTQVRAFLAYLVISGSCFSLKYLIENSDEINNRLLKELAAKNEKIQEQAKDEVIKANRELKANLERLSEREFILNQSQRIAKIGSWEYGLNDHFIFWSDEMYNIFGLDNKVNPDQITLKGLFGESAEALGRAIELLLKTGKPFDITLQSRIPVGYQKWVRFYSFPVEQDGEIVRVRGICHDITFYKESEKLLKDRQFRYHRLFEHAPYPIILTDEDGQVIDCNTSLCELINMDKEELSRISVSGLLIEDYSEMPPFNVKKLSHGDSVRYNGRITNGNVTIHVEVNAKRLCEDRVIFMVRDLTEIKRASELFEESETRFRTAFELSANGMAIISTEGQFLKVNRQLCSITGYGEHELLTLNISDVTYTFDKLNASGPFNEALDGKRKTYQLEVRLIHKTGAVVWVSISMSLVRNAGNMPQYFVSQITDISFKKFTEFELIEAETKFRTLIEKSLVGVYIVKGDNFDYVNPAFADIFGYSTYELLQMKTFAPIVYEEDLEMVRDNVKARIVRQLDHIRYELRGRKKNGDIIWLEAFGSRIPYQGGDAILGTVIDITKRKKYEKEQVLLSAIIKSTDDAIISCSLDGTINSWNNGAKKMFGYSRDEVIDKPIAKLIPKVTREEENMKLGAVLKEGVVEHYISQWTRKGGKLIDISLTISALYDESKTTIGLSVIGRDVTFRMQAEKAIRESEERYKELVENAIEALVVIDVESGKFVNVSKSAEELFQLSRETLLNMGPADVSPDVQPDGTDSAELFAAQIYEAVAKGRISFEWVHSDAEKNEIPCEIKLIRIPSETGTFVRGSITDISERIVRDKELAEAHKKIGELKLMALRSVMSPHFVFNVLNSIQYYITQNDRLNAINYLSTFSKLVRSILNYSMDNKIRLSDEVELLKNYIQLEMIRFENGFDFTIDMDPDIDTDCIKIPSLLIQPYVENAILHGLNNKKDKGRLTIRVTERDQVVYFEIEDNGIGREAAMKLRKKNFPSHKSMGIKLTEERLRLINESQNVSMFIEDLKNEKGPCGTRVFIGIKT